MSAVRPALLLVKIDAASITTTRDAPPSAGPPPQPLDGRAAPPRRAARRPAPVQGAPWLCSSGAGRRRGRAAAARAVSAERVHSRTAQNEIRVVLEAVVVVFACARLSDCEVILSRASGVKTLARLGRGYSGPTFAAQMAVLAAQRLQARAGTFSRSIPQI